MQVNETLSEGLRHEFQVSIPAAEITAKADERLVNLKDKVKINGFRPGKVPVDHLKKLYGRSVMVETIEDTIRDTNMQIVNDRGLKLAGNPKVTMPSEPKEIEDILAGKSDLSYSVAIEVVPPIELADFKSFTLEKPVVDVSDADVDEAVKRIAEQNRTYSTRAEGAKAENGDRITISFKGTIDGELFEGGSSEDILVVLGSNALIPGFEEQLVGAGVGETRTVKASFPGNYADSELAGKDAEFETTVSLIEAPEDLKIDDEFAKLLGLEELDQLRQVVREQLSAEFARAMRQHVKRALFDRLDETHKFDAPPTLVEEEFEQVWKTIMAEMEKEKKTFADENTTEEEAKAEYRRIADRRVRLSLVLSEIGEKNGITVADDEINRALISRARQTPGREKEIWDYYQRNPQALAQIRAPLFENKVVDFILELATITEKSVTREDLFKEHEAHSAEM